MGKLLNNPVGGLDPARHTRQCARPQSLDESIDDGTDPSKNMETPQTFN